jgi:hypothetical protein
MNTLQLKKEHLEQIGEYVRKQLPEWVDAIPQFSVSANIELRERIVRIEDQREIILRGFEQVDKRFEQVDRRFELMQNSMDKRFELMQESITKQLEQVDKRLSFQTKMILFGFSMMSAAISVAITLVHFSKV